MEANQARSVLLEQHDGLRRLLASAQRLAALAVEGEDVVAALEVEMGALRRAFAQHNVSEEKLLTPILALDPAWGPARVARMREEHDAEHRSISEALIGPTLEVASRLSDIVEDLDAHMCAEERTFLASAVLRDDIVQLEDGD